jgi:hypothetical protein
MSVKDLWFQNYERALADRESDGFSGTVAEDMAADDADWMTRNQLADAADLARMRRKEGSQ